MANLGTASGSRLLPSDRTATWRSGSPPGLGAACPLRAFTNPLAQTQPFDPRRGKTYRTDNIPNPEYSAHTWDRKNALALRVASHSSWQQPSNRTQILVGTRNDIGHCNQTEP